ncbi:MAG: DEAD/DEAH box helicase, partial [Bacteroidota bacterium]
DLLRIKPLGGSEEEETAVFLPLKLPSETISSSSFPEPQADEIGDFETAKLLFNAARLSFRNSAGPFRCMGKLSFRPRSYQLVPLVMALKQDVTRLMIADDVGIGKTVEALIILKEMMERGEVKRFAVICPPHLCEQWQQEIKDKLDLEAEIIRSSTAARLDRMIPDDQSLFHHIRYQVISIDYIKSDRRRSFFINDCPDFVIVDEAHTCALPEGSKSKAQQQRHQLLHQLSEKETRHLLLLTATPHSGKDAEFQSLLGLLKPNFAEVDLEEIGYEQKKIIAGHFIQRKREHIRRWLNEDTEFPRKDARDIGYYMTDEHHSFYQHLLQFARGISQVQASTSQASLLRSWAAIALIKGAMSSPDMAVEMLERRKEKLDNQAEDAEVPSIEETLFEDADYASDIPRMDLLESVDFAGDELQALNALQAEAIALVKHQNDRKFDTALKSIQKWLKDGFDPIIFCHYI